MEKIKLSEKEREVINLAISIASGCQPCTKYHINKCKKAAISEKDINVIIEQSEQIGIKATEIMKQRAVSSLYLDQKNEIELNLNWQNKTEILVGLSVSCTLNNTSLFDYFLKECDVLEINSSEISYILESSKFIFGKAKAHVDILSESKGINSQDNVDDKCKPGCGC